MIDPVALLKNGTFSTYGSEQFEILWRLFSLKNKDKMQDDAEQKYNLETVLRAASQVIYECLILINNSLTL